MYAMFETESMSLIFHRVPYDYEAAARAIRRAGLPDYYAERLALGE
jgi:diadenosine tetraphosphatase ApaH/serine/threonine PP2A family protein phosphatase